MIDTTTGTFRGRCTKARRTALANATRWKLEISTALGKRVVEADVPRPSPAIAHAETGFALGDLCEIDYAANTVRDLTTGTLATMP